jgi:hypothetical protein
LSRPPKTGPPVVYGPPDPNSAASPSAAVQPEVTDAWQALRTALGTTAPANLDAGRTTARSLHWIVR